MTILLQFRLLEFKGIKNMHNNKTKHSEAHHEISVYQYWAVFGGLVLLTLLTVYLAKYDFGSLSVAVTLCIAGFKAFLVLAFFMHLWYDSKFFSLILGVTLVFLGLFFLFPILDESTRGLIDPVRENYLPRDEKVYQHQIQNPNALPLRPGLREPDKSHLIFENAQH
jgi:cytochrome c oxidase subunit IV